ncbi:MAG: hypothetical protein MI974_03835 [Chitinophagales bacterium]|nr:hypothetical protein [Chitinophagales bacterium]
MHLKLIIVLFSFLHLVSLSAQNALQTQSQIKLKPDSLSPAIAYQLVFDENGKAQGGSENLQVKQEIKKDASNVVRYTYTITARKHTHFSFHQKWLFSNYKLDRVDFFMPGFWYKKNLRSPENAPSIQVAKNWCVREDRLSSPLVATFHNDRKDYVYIRRSDKLEQESLLPKKEGEIILPSKSSIGSLGFYTETNSSVSLTAQYPFYEAPYSYQSKLTLNPALESFITLRAGESISFSWEVITGKANDFTDFVEQIWAQSFDFHQPQPLEQNLGNHEIKSILTNYFKESLATTNGLTGFSGLWFDMKSCETTGVLSVGFCGRTLLNAFNLLEYATINNDQELLDLANRVIDSYFKDGWTNTGLIRELIYRDYKEDVYSLRKQTEGIVALMYILKFKKDRGEDVSDIESRVKKLLDRFAQMQATDGSLPRKFGVDFGVLDDSKGSTQLIITPMLMASSYFDHSAYFEIAKKAAHFVEKNLIDKADYFSSTLDSNCEDKEAALIASTSLCQLASLTQNPNDKKHLMDLAEKAATFALSWYYLYDVPFAKGQLLKGANLKTRGWGSVSTENNHIDVYVFDFLEALRWLGKVKSRDRFIKMADVIESSIRDQMLPYPYHMVSVGKEGFMPEIIQQTLWDYGANGKGFLNVHGSIGWTVASVWEMLSPGRFEWFVKG